ncbi:WLM-domain-containing protein [Laetiporus sulphureus 93-53]|uniref:WLM-domain-containing protein n=1 Tax=Laetiporus sulphureus 93-53 TaxID=1314785 RepID=A0A165EKA7_9APHY|nr:WLM-domain-containing protein [Laetiporus sulphureus 93-53]KZT07234.1 WLM-domain-containing protein [Laetiporus sulphureus 93-53]
MSSSDTSPIEITVTHRGVAHRLSLLPDDTMTVLQARLEELTSVPPSLQKLLYKGKKANIKDDVTLTQAGLKNGMKVQMLGTTSEELGSLRAVEDERARKERIMRERAKKAPVKVRSTGSSSSSALNYRFHRIEPLAHLPEPPTATAFLTRLANDPAILHVMQKHQFSVGVLTELAPHEQPGLLGLNVNAGQAIKLRIRTDRYDGFRLYKDVRRVLCHELTHNVWGDHDNNFKEMNSMLNREVVEFERSMAEGTHRFIEGGVYQPSSELELEAETYLLSEGPQVLGGSVSGGVADESREERRRRMLEATMNRLRKQEEELEHQCGTAGQSRT